MKTGSSGYTASVAASVSRLTHPSSLTERGSGAVSEPSLQLSLRAVLTAGHAA